MSEEHKRWLKEAARIIRTKAPVDFAGSVEFHIQPKRKQVKVKVHECEVVETG